MDKQESNRWREVCEGCEPIYSSLPDEKDVRELLSFFIDEMAHHVSGMERAVDEKNWRELDLHAHQLKGSGSGFGFEIVTDLSRNVEGMIRGEEMDEEELIEAARNLISVCRRIAMQR